jgi:hypothetical protein
MSAPLKTDNRSSISYNPQPPSPDGGKFVFERSNAVWRANAFPLYDKVNAWN